RCYLPLTTCPLTTHHSPLTTHYLMDQQAPVDGLRRRWPRGSIHGLIDRFAPAKADAVVELDSAVVLGSYLQKSLDQSSMAEAVQCLEQERRAEPPAALGRGHTQVLDGADSTPLSDALHRPTTACWRRQEPGGCRQESGLAPNLGHQMKAAAPIA